MIHHCLAGWFSLHSVPELVSWGCEPDCQEELQVHGQAGTFYRLSPGVPGAAEKLNLQL